MNVSLGIHSLHLQALFPSKSSNYRHLRFSTWKKEELRSALNVLRVYILTEKQFIHNSKEKFLIFIINDLIMQNCLGKTSYSMSCVFIGDFMFFFSM